MRVSRPRRALPRFRYRSPMKMSIDQELLISLIHERPVIWDKTIDDYRNKRMKFDSWDEICRHLNPGYEDLSSEAKVNYGQFVTKKWINMKDNWIKCNKKMKEEQSRFGGKKMRKYQFYDDMSFLKKNIDREADSKVTEQVNVSEGNKQTLPVEVKVSEAPKPKKMKRNKKGLSTVATKLMKYMDATVQEERSRSMNFFRGISETVDKFSDENMIDFQFQVISIIKCIQQRELYMPTHRNERTQGYQATVTVPVLGHSSGLEQILNRPESHGCADSGDSLSSSADSLPNSEEEFN